MRLRDCEPGGLAQHAPRRPRLGAGRMSNKGRRAAGSDLGRVLEQELVAEFEVPLGEFILLAKDPKCGVYVVE